MLEQPPCILDQECEKYLPSQRPIFDDEEDDHGDAIGCTKGSVYTKDT